MRLELNECIVRPWSLADAADLALHANDREVWRNLRDGFPHPYTLQDAQRFLIETCARTDPDAWAIEVEGHAVGGVSLKPLEGILRLSAEIGIWIGRAYQSRGIAVAVTRAVTLAGMRDRGLRRIFAHCMAWNVGAARTLEKSGFVLEGRLRDAVFKDGCVVDALVYSFTRAEME